MSRITADTSLQEIAALVSETLVDAEIPTALVDEIRDAAKDKILGGK